MSPAEAMAAAPEMAVAAAEMAATVTTAVTATAVAASAVTSTAASAESRARQQGRHKDDCNSDGPFGHGTLLRHAADTAALERRRQGAKVPLGRQPGGGRTGPPERQ
jgi:hypothetical protein